MFLIMMDRSIKFIKDQILKAAEKLLRSHWENQLQILLRPEERYETSWINRSSKMKEKRLFQFN